MASRPLIIASLLGASVGVPYVASHATHGLTAPASAGLAAAATPNATAPPGGTTSIPSQITATPAPATSAVLLPPSPATAAQPVANYPLASPQVRLLPPIAASTAPNSAAATYAPVPTAMPQSTAQFASVSQVLRFDVTKDWVCRAWPRKSTGPTDVGLFAIRVPLVMGTQMSSLVGALTYYFNAQDQVEHISFRGRTGDAVPLVQYLTQTYRFQPVVSPTGEKIFQVANDNGLQSELRLHPEAVLDSNLPQQSIAVELELARPGSQRILPPHGPALQVPQVESAATSPPPGQPPSAAAPTPSGANAATPAAAANSSGYWNQVRYATQDEQTPMFDKRWPQ